DQRHHGREPEQGPHCTVLAATAGADLYELGHPPAPAAAPMADSSAAVRLPCSARRTSQRASPLTTRVRTNRTSPAAISAAQRVAPRASAASLWSGGTVAMTSRVMAVTIGRIMIARISPATK